MQESKYLFAFSDLINAEIEKTRGSIRKVFLKIKIGPWFMGSLVYSLVKLWWY
jgi:hypothetical protein